MKVEKRITNAEKLAKDIEFMADSVAGICLEAKDCWHCRFSIVEGRGTVCPIRADNSKTIRDCAKEWLEQEVEDESRR